MDLDAFRWLLTDDGQRLLAEAAGAAGRTTRCAPQAELRRTARRRPHVAAALTQVELRGRAREPSSATHADRMYFTPDGLEQATRLPRGRRTAPAGCRRPRPRRR